MNPFLQSVDRLAHPYLIREAEARLQAEARKALQRILHRCGKDKTLEQHRAALELIESEDFAELCRLGLQHDVKLEARRALAKCMARGGVHSGGRDG